MARETGSVKWFSNEKGYGFIERESGEDVFVHHSDIEGEGFKTLRQDERVEFELISAEKGPKALNVVREEHLQDGGSEPGDGPVPTEAREEEATRGETEREPAGDRSLGSQLREKLGKRFFNEEG